MDSRLAHYLHTKRIDSFQKLYFLLFLHNHPDMRGTDQEFAKRLYFGDRVFLTKIMTDLQSAGLIDYVENGYKLCDEPHVKSHLRKLATAFEDPLTRQEILDHVGYGTSLDVTSTPHPPPF